MRNPDIKSAESQPTGIRDLMEFIEGLNTNEHRGVRYAVCCNLRMESKFDYDDIAVLKFAHAIRAIPNAEAAPRTGVVERFMSFFA